MTAGFRSSLSAAVANRDSNGRPRPEVPIGGRILEGGARGVGRIAGATGIDRTVEVAVEEAIVRDWCARAGINYGGRAVIGHDSGNRVVPFGRV